ncbi:MAG: cold-shock protein [Desulfovibrio sp.]
MIGRVNGTVDWFNEKIGFGFIVSDDGLDIYVHHSAIRREGFATLTVGEKVSFIIDEDAPGYVALSVVPENPGPVYRFSDYQSCSPADSGAKK